MFTCLIYSQIFANLEFIMAEGNQEKDKIEGKQITFQLSNIVSTVDSLIEHQGTVEICSYSPEFILTGVTCMHLYRLGELTLYYSRLILGFILGLIEDTELDGLLEDALLDYDTPSKPIPKTETQHSDAAVPQECNSLLTDALDPANLEELNSMMEGILGKDLLKEYETFSKELEQKLPDMFDLQGLEVRLIIYSRLSLIGTPGYRSIQ